MFNRYSRFTILAALFLAPLFLFSPILADDVQDEIDELNDRVDALELKIAKNKVSFFGDFRVKYDYLKFEYPAYNQFLGFDPATGMPMFAAMDAYELSNDENWSARLRLKIDAKPTPELHFTGRLSMHHTYGGFGVPVFNGFPNTVAFDANSTALGGDNILRVERAAFTWDPSDVPLFITLGRQASSGGPPREIREDRVRQGTPGALMIDAEIDGVMLGVHFDEVIEGAPDGTNIRLCYGTGYESGFGTGGRTSNASTIVGVAPDGSLAAMPLLDLSDSRVAGGCFETSIPPVPGKTLLSGGYFRMIDMTDISTGYTRNFPNQGDGNPQLVTSTNNLGDMDLMGICFQHEYKDFAWFASFAYNKSHPDSGQESGYGFGGLLGNTMDSETGSCYYLGGRIGIPSVTAQLGLEYNHGSEYWFSYTPAGDDFGMSKLATRGSVLEMYVTKKLEKKLNLRVGAQFFSYDYAFSGWHIAPSPMQMPDGSILNGSRLDDQPYLFYPFPDKATNIYAMLDLTF